MKTWNDSLQAWFDKRKIGFVRLQSMLYKIKIQN